MSATISKRLNPDFPKINTFSPELSIITIVYNPDNNRLTTNIDNVSIEDCIKMLSASIGIVASGVQDTPVTVSDTDHTYSLIIGGTNG